MNSRTWLNVAMLAAIATVLAVAAIAVPSERFGAPVILAVLLFAAAVGFVFYVPRAARSGSDAANLASIGPAGALSTVLLIWTGVSVFVALAGMNTASFAMDAIAIGGFIVSWSLLKIGNNIVTQGSAQTESPSRHSAWQTRVAGLPGLCKDDATRQGVTRLADNLRYAARDVFGSALPENDRIDSLVDTLESAVLEGDAARALAGIAGIEAAMARREYALKALRSKV